ncbi:unnamed protein product [Soboliphyme baturini]|uniref:RING-type domain-containing protein n=1 Tax=Soboliphyme baturini TaxID=241478 RepID=A0A183IZ42_9BILA|nr:unnamed protein product [Soboliphyme baturini]
MTSISRAMWLRLYKDLISQASKFTEYSYRCFARRRVREYFLHYRHEKDPVLLEHLYAEGERNVELLKRQTVVNSLYPGPKLVIEKQPQQRGIAVRARRSCPQCKSSDYNNRDFVLMINECGHPLCRNCVDRMFSRQSGPCPTCRRVLKRSSFWQQMFEDPLTEKEVFFRKKLQKVFTLVENDFPDLRSYNDYLEKFENLVFNLVNDRHVEETKREVAEFAKQHEEQIARSKNRKTKDDEWIQAMLDEEEMMHQRVMSEVTNVVDESVTESSENRPDAIADDIINELMTSSIPAELIISNKKRQLFEKMKATAGQTPRSDAKRRKLLTVDTSNFTVPNEGEKYEYTERQLLAGIMFCGSFSKLAEDGFLAHVKPATSVQRAGGYDESLACLRALQEAHCDLDLVKVF